MYSSINLLYVFSELAAIIRDRNKLVEKLEKEQHGVCIVKQAFAVEHRI